jgi:hypothetical protein
VDDTLLYSFCLGGIVLYLLLPHSYMPLSFVPLSHRPLRIVLWLATGHGNLGDELLLYQECLHLHASFPQATLVVPTPYPHKTREVFDFHASPHTYSSSPPLIPTHPTYSPAAAYGSIPSAPYVELVPTAPHHLRRHPFANISYTISLIRQILLSHGVVFGGG